MYFHVLCSVSLVYVSVFIAAPFCFGYYVSGVWLEIRYCDVSTIPLFVQDCFCYSGSFAFSNNFRIIITIILILPNVIGILEEIVLNL
jgi:hypothetical protein